MSSLQIAFDSRIYYDDPTDLIVGLRNLSQNLNPMICFIHQHTYIHKKASLMLSQNIPNNWSIIALESTCAFQSKKCEYYRISSLTNLSGFFIKSSLIPLILNQLQYTDILSAINNTIHAKISYAFYEPLVFKYECQSSPIIAPNDISFYNYIDQHHILKQQTLNNITEFTLRNNISVRHHLSHHTNYISIQEIIEIFDFKLGFHPSFISELINLASIDILYDDISSYIESYLCTTPKPINITKTINKDIINKFFDCYIYGELPMCIVIPSYNNIKWYEKNLNSIFKQKYHNYRVIYVDDQSTDGTYDAVKKYVQSYDMSNRCSTVCQTKRNYQACGRYMAYMMTDDDEIICNVDGDDWLYDRDDQHQYRTLEYVEEAYSAGALSTYGCFYKSSGPQWLEPTTIYTEDIIDTKAYRTSKYLCKHLRTGYAGLYKNINLSDIIDHNKKFISMSTDLFTQYPVLEMSGHMHVNLLKPSYIYNQDNSMLYPNSWYNLNDPNNQNNLAYYESLQIKLKSIQPYPTLESYNISQYHHFDHTTEILQIVFVATSHANISYLMSKIKHEIKPHINYNLQIIDVLSQYTSKDSSLILFIDNLDKISVNLNPLPYLKLILESKINHLLFGDHLTFKKVDNPDLIPLTPLDSPYVINLRCNDIPMTLSNGFYTRELFEKLIQTDQMILPHSLILESKQSITYLIPVYQTPMNWLKECLDSLLGQTTQNFYVVVSDDHSPNLNYVRELYRYLWELSDRYWGARLRITSTSKNKGLAGNNHHMIGFVHTQCVGLLDSDDAIMGETTQIILDGYDKCDADFIYTNFNYCDENLQFKYPGYCKSIPADKSALETNTISHLKTFKVESYHHTLGYDSTFRSAEDKDIIFKFEEAKLNFLHVPMRLYNYRVTSNSLSRSNNSILNDKTIQYTIDAIRDTYYRFPRPNLLMHQVWSKYKVYPNQSTYQTYFNSFFDHIYVINLQTQNKNLSNMILRLKMIGANNVTFIRPSHAKNIPKLRKLLDYITSEPLTTTLELLEKTKLIKTIGELGCIESHLMCLMDADINQFKNILILEDDVYFDKHFLIKFKEYTESIRSNWLYLMLGSSQWSWWGNAPFIENHTFHPTRASMGTFALGINHRIIPDLINSLSMYTGPTDLGGYLQAVIPNRPHRSSESVHSIHYIYENKYPINKCYVLYPNLVVPDTRHSDIRSEIDSESDWHSRSKRMNWKLHQKNLIVASVEIPHTYEIIKLSSVDEIYSNLSLEPNSVILDIDPERVTPYDIHQLRLQYRSVKLRICGTIPKNFIYYYHRISDLIITESQIS